MSAVVVGKVADAWVEKRNAGVAWAVELDRDRVRMKNLWYSVMLSYTNNPDYAGEMMSSLLFDDYPLGREIALKTILTLEPLDKAACRANISKCGKGLCDWPKHQSKIYSFIRSTYQIPEDWPHICHDTPIKSDDLAQMVYMDMKEGVEGGEGEAGAGEAGGD